LRWLRLSDSPSPTPRHSVATVCKPLLWLCASGSLREGSGREAAEEQQRSGRGAAEDLEMHREVAAIAA